VQLYVFRHRIFHGVLKQQQMRVVAAPSQTGGYVDHRPLRAAAAQVAGYEQDFHETNFA
jgi:hypothetical protein